jgi:hypothetical protein
MRSNAKLIDLVVDRYINLELFKSKQEVQPNGCIEWRGPKNNAGYGMIGFRLKVGEERAETRMMTVHRLAFMIAKKRSPAKPNINHTCHNKLCVNPKHLVEGTQSEKMAKMRADGIRLGGTPKGHKRGAYNHKQENHNYKYSDDEIQWIRTAEPKAIAKKFKISITRAGSKQWQFRHGYAWLPAPIVYEYRKRGRKKRTTK